MVFSWQVIIKIPIPRLFTEYYHLNTQQIGLQYISLIIGSVIGEQMGGLSSDRWMWYGERRSGMHRRPEFRLWLSHVG